MGKQAIDGDNNQTGQKLAALLGYPQQLLLQNYPLPMVKLW